MKIHFIVPCKCAKNERVRETEKCQFYCLHILVHLFAVREKMLAVENCYQKNLLNVDVTEIFDRENGTQLNPPL